MAVDDEFVEVAGLGRLEAVQGEIVREQQIDAAESTHFVVVTAVEACAAESICRGTIGLVGSARSDPRLSYEQPGDPITDIGFPDDAQGKL